MANIDSNAPLIGEARAVAHGLKGTAASCRPDQEALRARFLHAAAMIARLVHRIERSGDHVEQVDALLAEVNRAFAARGELAVDEVQRDCLLDPALADDALDMLDDWEARCGLSPSLRGELAALVVTASEGVHVSARDNELKREAEGSCAYRVRLLAEADDEVDQTKLWLEAGFFAGRVAALEEISRETETVERPRSSPKGGR